MVEAAREPPALGTGTGESVVKEDVEGARERDAKPMGLMSTSYARMDAMEVARDKLLGGDMRVDMKDMEGALDREDGKPRIDAVGLIGGVGDIEKPSALEAAWEREDMEGARERDEKFMDVAFERLLAGTCA